MDQPSIDYVKRTLTLAAEIYRTHAKTFIATVAVVLVPIALLGLAVDTFTHFSAEAALSEAQEFADQERGRTAQWPIDISFADDDDAVARELAEESTKRIESTTLSVAGWFATAFGGLVVRLLILMPLQLLGVLLAEGAVLIQVDAILRHVEVPGPRETWQRVMGRFLPLLLTASAVVISTAVGCLLFLIPGLWFLYRSMLVTPVVLLEGRSGVLAIGRSFSLVKVMGRPMLLFLFVLGMLDMVTSWVAELLLPSSIEGLGAAALEIALLPIFMIWLMLAYRDAVARAQPAGPLAIADAPA